MEHLDVIAAAGRQRMFRARCKVMQPELVSHVTQRAAGKEVLFLEQGDYLSFLALFKESALKYNVQVLAFCLMPNHVHILIRPREQNLDRSMHAVFMRYAMWFNRKYQRKGHLFGGPYRQAVCLDPTYLLGASVYIHLNPVRAGLADTPREYRWSSYALYHEDGAKHSFVDPALLLDQLAGERDEAHALYRRLMENGRDVDCDTTLEKAGVVERFCFRLRALCPDILAALAGKRSGEDNPEGILPEMVDLEQMIADYRAAPSQNVPESRKAREYLVKQLLARGFTRREIADQLGVTRKTVYNILRGS